MNRKYIVIFTFLCVFFYCNAIRNFGYSTLLLMVEESENGVPDSQKETPVFDGLIDYLWETDILFFDMQLGKTIPTRNGVLDPVPFLAEAKYSGADMVLLIKINYQFTEKDGTSEFILAKIPYTYYSLTNYAPVKNGLISVNLQKTFNSRKKREILREIGKELGAKIE